MRSEIDNKAQGQSCFIDLQKAFDTLDHKILMSKLDSYGFRGKIHDIIGSYLSDRKQYVSYNETNTPCLNVETGIPQGLVKRPLLFLLHIDDINLGERDSKLAIFVDHTTIIKANREGCCSIQQKTDRLYEWFCAKRLSISQDKCESISFGKGHPSKLRILDKTLTYKSACKYVGVFVDRYPRFSEHIEFVVKKQ